MADCHPDRPHQAKGLCSFCYMRTYDTARRERRNAAKRKAPEDYSPNYRKPPHQPSRPPHCHPDRKQVAHGLCKACYQKAKRDGTLASGQATCHPDRPLLAKGLCHQCYASKQYWDDPEKYREIQRERGKATRARVRAEMVAAYGGRCACASCPETNPAFLTLDHVNGDGKAHRVRVGSHTYNDLRKRGWPRDGFRLLCWNCNAMTRYGRTCPHEPHP